MTRYKTLKLHFNLSISHFRTKLVKNEFYLLMHMMKMRVFKSKLQSVIKPAINHILINIRTRIFH